MRLATAAVMFGTGLGGIVPGFGAFGATGSLEAIMARMDEAAANFKSLSADIRKVSYTAVLKDTLSDEGTILVKRPKPRDMRVLIDFKKPDPKTVAIAGKKVEIFIPKINTVQEYDAGKNRELLDQFLLLGFGSTSADLNRGYTIKAGPAETVAGQKTIRLELIPKSKEVLAHLNRVELWISDTNGLPAQQKFHMPGGDFTQATYSNVKVNPNLPDSALKLNLPKGVKRETPQK